MPSVDDDIDRLYQLPLDQFTAERNALAKRAGAKRADIRELPKPPLAAWAVNQVHWQQPRVSRALIDASEKLRAAHKAVLSGKKADLRATGKDHEEALDGALKAALAILADSGHPVTDATRQAILNTLRALPVEDPPGRLTRALQPGGFEMLAGVSPLARVGAAAPAGRKSTRAEAAASKASAKAAKKEGAAKPSPAVLARARSDAAAAARAVRDAENAARREEFESARAARDAEKAERNLAAARRALEQAQRDLEEAEEEAAAAAKTRDQAAARAAKADEALSDARSREKATQAELDAIT
jgi:hypothetical protein